MEATIVPSCREWADKYISGPIDKTVCGDDMKDSHWLYRHHSNAESLINAISSFGLSSKFPVKFLFLISKGDLFQLIKEWLPYRYSLWFLEEHDELITVKISREIRGREKRHISGNFNLMRYKNTNIYIALTHEKQEFVKKVLSKFFGNFYSESSRLHLTSGQIQDILDLIKEKMDCRIITDRVISYSRLDRERFVIIGKKPRLKESDVRWTEEDYKESFRRAAENDQWIDRISFYTQRGDNLLFHASLSREGLFECDNKVKEFYETITEYLLGVGRRSIDLYSNRSRMENNGEIKPIVIEYPNNIFENLQQNKKLIKVISEFPKSSYSVYHSNPYVHLSLVDYVDGSSYDLWVVSADRLVIVPQIRATFNSLSRLCEHVLKRFSEGRIDELKVKK